jgi:hypothetical protein
LILRHDFLSFAHRAFIELNPQISLSLAPHLEVALRHVLVQTDMDLGRQLETTEELRIRQRAELVRRLLAPQLIT